MPGSRRRWLTSVARWLRLAALGVAGWAALVVLTMLSVGALYIWVMTGTSPVAQVRDAGLASLVFWSLGGLFAGLHIAGAFLMERPYGPWGVAGVTLCLVALWVFASRRAKAHRQTVLQRDR